MDTRTVCLFVLALVESLVLGDGSFDMHLLQPLQPVLMLRQCAGTFKPFHAVDATRAKGQPEPRISRSSKVNRSACAVEV